jgi:hypothetical protein
MFNENYNNSSHLALMPSKNLLNTKKWRGSLSCLSFSFFLLLLLIVDGYYFVILYTISSGGGGYVMIFNKSKLKIKTSCQSAHCKGATNCFLFSLYSLKTYCHQALETTPTY